MMDQVRQNAYCIVNDITILHKCMVISALLRHVLSPHVTVSENRKLISPSAKLFLEPGEKRRTGVLYGDSTNILLRFTDICCNILMTLQKQACPFFGIC